MKRAGRWLIRSAVVIWAVCIVWMAVEWVVTAESDDEPALRLRMYGVAVLLGAAGLGLSLLADRRSRR